jgi:hypothetical protein
LHSVPSLPCHLHQYHLFSPQRPEAPTEKDMGMLLGKVGMLVHQLVTSVHHLSCCLDTAWYHMLQELCYSKGIREDQGVTRDENQRQRVATRCSWLSAASRRIKATSPPGHHSSDPSPPKLLEEAEGRRLEALRLAQEAERTRVLESTRPLEPTARPLPSLLFLALA